MDITGGHPALLLAASTTSQILNALNDNTFSGLYRLQPFDYAVLIPYFAVLGTSVGLRLPPLRNDPDIFQASQEDSGRASVKFEQLPRVTIQLPLYNERYVVERLLEETVKMDYPRESAADPGAGRFDRRYASVYRSAGGRVPGRRVIRSSITIARTATGTRPALCRKA